MRFEPEAVVVEGAGVVEKRAVIVNRKQRASLLEQLAHRREQHRVSLVFGHPELASKRNRGTPKPQLAIVPGTRREITRIHPAAREHC